MRNCFRADRAYAWAIRVFFLGTAVLLAGQQAWAERSDRQRSRSDVPATKNVILMISDGGGFHHVDAASLYEYGKTGVQVYEQFPVRLAMSTFSAGRGRSGEAAGYDPGAAWTDPTYVARGYTDSAAASTTMSTGRKTRNGTIGLDPSGKPLVHAWEHAESRGKATGVVTTVQFSHATPAGFLAHNSSRNNYAAIARQMILESASDVIMGCGHPWFDANGAATTQPNKFDYVGGRQTWDALAAGTAGADADGDGKADPWTLIQTRDQFRALMSGPTPKRVCGVAPAYKTLQQGRAGDANAAPFQVALTATVPTLAEMTRAAINVLDEDPDGFCVMVEGGAVDWASHDNQAGRTIEEQIDFNHAVQAAVEWVEAHSNWSETLLIVTADHETGYLTAPAGAAAKKDRTAPDASAPLVNRGKGAMPGMRWNSGQHTNSLIPLYAKGDAARLLVDAADQRDPVRGAYLDNAELGKILNAVVAGQ